MFFKHALWSNLILMNLSLSVVYFPGFDIQSLPGYVKRANKIMVLPRKFK